VMLIHLFCLRFLFFLADNSRSIYVGLHRGKPNLVPKVKTLINCYITIEEGALSCANVDSVSVTGQIVFWTWSPNYSNISWNGSHLILSAAATFFS